MIAGIRQLLTAIILLTAALLNRTASAQEHPGWSRAEFLSHAADLLGIGTPEIKDVDEFPRGILIDPTEEATCFLREGERASYFAAGEFSSVVLIGNGERIHTLWFYFPILNVRDTDAAFAFYRGIFDHLLPEWTAGGDWAEQSLSASWEPAGRAFIDPTISIDDTIARHTEGGVRLATWGVPPDLVFYRITARAECEKISPFLLASPREIPKDEAVHNLDQDWGQLLLNNIYPQPVDVSATPILLGSAHFGGGLGTNSANVSFDMLPDTEIDLTAWIDRQVINQRFGSTNEAIRDVWGYTSHFIHLISDPDLAVVAGGEPHLLVIEKLSAEVTGSLEEGLAYSVLNAEAVIFASSVPPARDKEPVAPEMYVEGADVVIYGNENPAPIDVSATPIHLGRMHLYAGGHSADRPGFYEVSVAGMAVIAEDRASGARAELDMAAWAAGQGNLDGPPGARPITDPLVRFEMAGKQHVLVVQGITLDRDGEGTVDSLTGQLFSAR